MSSRSQRRIVQLPPETTMKGKKERGQISLIKGGKPPKLRFRPGQYIQYKGQLYELMFAYRLKEDPHEWIYCLEERRSLSGRPKDTIAAVSASLGCGDGTPRIVYDIFHDGYQVFEFFIDIPGNGDRNNVRNKDLLQHGEVISSGTVD